MEIILIPKRRNAHRRIHLGRLASAGLMAGLLVLGGSLVYGGFRFGLGGPANQPAVATVRWQQHTDDQRQRVADAIQNAEDNLEALALRLGQMQAEVIRLGAMGQRLVELSNLDADEFKFDAGPPIGGPEVAFTPGSRGTPDFVEALEALAAELDELSPKLGALEGVLIGRRHEDRVNPEGRPVNGGWISSYYGYRIDPITGKRAFHEGIDFAGKLNSEVVAVASGVVTWSAYRHGYGNMVEVDHGNGYVTRYAHNKKNLVTVGDIITKRQPLGLMGSSGRSTGPHVHFEVLRNGKSVNPIKFVRRAG